MNKCLCSTYEFGTTEQDPQTGEPYFGNYYTTGCRESTNKQFAMGHDAKLVGFLVRAYLAGEEIRHGSSTWTSATAAALWISPALATKAQAQLDAAKARAAKRTAREAAKTARTSAKAVAPAPVWRSAKIKVGRWTYDAQIEIATGDATYAAKLGGTKMVEKGQYTEV